MSDSGRIVIKMGFLAAILLIITPTLIVAFDLNCKFGTDNYYVDEFYHCKDDHNDIRLSSERTLNKVYGFHEDGFENPNVEAIWLEAYPIYYFPVGLSEHFGDMKAIWISYAQLMKLQSEDLEEYKELRLLHLNYGAISTIKSDTFIHNPKLEYLNLSNNRIFFVETGAFSGLEKLSSFLFNKNVCFNDGVSENPKYIENFVARIDESCKMQVESCI